MNNETLFTRRPKADDSEDDILAMQARWEAEKQQKERPAVQIQRMRRKGTDQATTSKEQSEPVQSSEPPPPPQSSRSYEKGGRFTIDLENIAEEWSNQVLFDVQERNGDWLTGDRSDELAKQGMERLQYSKDEGFPDVLDLSAYYSAAEGSATPSRSAPAGKSFFAAEFDRLNGINDDATCSAVAAETEDSNEDADFISENDKYISALPADKINEFRQEIEERLDPKLIAYLAQRHKKKKEQPESDESKSKVSKFKKSRQNQASGSEVTDQAQEKSSDVADPSSIESRPPQPPPVETVAEATSFSMEDMVKELEVLDEFADRGEEEQYNRLATDAVQMDFATKCLRTMMPRQQQNAIKLFDTLKHAPDSSSPSDSLLATARSRIDDIKQLYLEEVESDGKRFFQFARGLNPLIDGSWTLGPIRTVLDAVQQRENNALSSDDIDLVRLALLWTVLLHAERPSAFYSFAEPGEMYVRLTEVFLLGSSVLEDDLTMQCVTRLMNGYVLKSAVDGRLTLRLAKKIAGLDAFMPFYEDLLRHYESYSLGDVQFARAILIGAYLNAAVGDSLECRFGIWTPKQHTARQMTLNLEQAADILKGVRRLSGEQAPMMEEQHFTTYVSLLASYAAAIRDEKVTRDRNPLMFTIASEELGAFVKRHTINTLPSPEEKAKEIDTIVELIRTSLAGKVDV